MNLGKEAMTRVLGVEAELLAARLEVDKQRRLNLLLKRMTMTRTLTRWMLTKPRALMPMQLLTGKMMRIRITRSLLQLAKDGLNVESPGPRLLARLLEVV